MATQPPTVPATGQGATELLTQPQPPRLLPRWKVLLHNDDHNPFDHVIKSLVQLFAFSEQDAKLRALEAHETGLALLITTHKERAELYQEQLTSLNLTATIEPEA